MSEQPVATPAAPAADKAFGRTCPVCHDRFPSTEFRVHMDAEMDAYNAMFAPAEGR